MTDLTALADLPTSELRAEFARMFGTPSPAVTPELPPVIFPLDRVAAGDLIEETA